MWFRPGNASQRYVVAVDDIRIAYDVYCPSSFLFLFPGVPQPG
jgi:hypothetical protein